MGRGEPGLKDEFQIKVLEVRQDSYTYERGGVRYFGTMHALNAVRHLHPEGHPLREVGR